MWCAWLEVRAHHGRHDQWNEIATGSAAPWIPNAASSWRRDSGRRHGGAGRPAGRGCFWRGRRGGLAGRQPSGQTGTGFRGARSHAPRRRRIGVAAAIVSRAARAGTRLACRPGGGLHGNVDSSRALARAMAPCSRGRRGMPCAHAQQMVDSRTDGVTGQGALRSVRRRTASQHRHVGQLIGSARPRA